MKNYSFWLNEIQNKSKKDLVAESQNIYSLVKCDTNNINAILHALEFCLILFKTYFLCTDKKMDEEAGAISIRY